MGAGAIVAGAASLVKLPASASYQNVIERIFGAPLRQRVSDSSAVVGTSATKIGNLSPLRVKWVLVNLSGGYIYVWNDSSVSSSRGIPVAPNALLTYSVLSLDAGTPDEIYAVASAAGSNYLLIEDLLATQ